MATSDYETVLSEARRLTVEEQLRLREELAQVDMAEPPKPKRSLRGILADLGPAPSAAEIDEVQREMWRNFPRDDM